jgi:hypothetical protein
MQCNGQTISVIGDGSETAPTPQNAVVGQQIYLTTKVDSAGIPVTSNSWTVEGTKIAGYNPSTGPTNVTRLTDADLKKPDITFYWVYPNSVIPIVIPVTYSYCVNIPGMGNQCSLPADAAFNLSGPGDEQMTTDPYSSVNIDMLIDKLPCLPTSEDTGPYMQYGKLTGYDDIVCQGPLTGDAGIIFTPPAVTSSGKYSFVQIITRDKVTYSNGTNSGAFITTPGLDKIYPYTQWSDGRAPDAPDSVLRPTDKRSSRTFNATMYLLWTSSIPNSIPVPIGSQKWKIAQARTTNPGYPTNQSWTQPVWNVLGTDGDPIDYVQTAPSQTPYGYPTWKGLATPVWFITEANETDQEEEQ